MRILEIKLELGTLALSYPILLYRITLNHLVRDPFDHHLSLQNGNCFIFCFWLYIQNP